MGANIIIPIINAAIALIKTAAAAISFTLPAFKLYSGEIISVSNSIDEFIISEDITSEKMISSISHSVIFIFSKNPRINTITTANK